MITKSKLAIKLSKLKTFATPKVKSEQYPTDSEIAAEVLWNASLLNDVEDKTIADLGAGTGILSLGAIELGAKKVYLVEQDASALEIAKENVVSSKAVFINENIESFDKQVDLVIQNPPFGTKTKHADKEFLQKAFEIAPVVYSFHKESTANFVEAISRDNGFRITHHWKFEFPIKQTQKFHKSRILRIEVGCWRFERVNNG